MKRLLAFSFSGFGFAAFIFLSTLLLPGISAAESSELAAADSLFQVGKFEAVELMVLRLGEQPETMTADEYADLQTLAGFSMIMLDREDSARDYFLKALEAKPELALDPIQVSPKFRIVFDEVKESFEARETPTLAVPSSTIRSSSHLLNLLLPGIGQIREDYTLRGVGWLTVQLASAGWLVYSLGKASDSRKDYLSQTEQSAIERTYDTYNSNHRVAWAAGITTAAVYLLCQADLALLSPRVTSDKSGAKIALGPEPRGVRLSVHW